MSEQPKRNPMKYLVLLVLLLSVVYIAEMNSLSTQGYEINAIERELQEAKRQNTELNMQMAQTGSIAGLQEVPFVATMDSSEFLHIDHDQALVQR